MALVPPSRVFDPYGVAQQDPTSPVSVGQEPGVINYDDVVSNPRYRDLVLAPGGLAALQKAAAENGRKLVGAPIQQQGYGPGTELAPSPQPTIPFGPQQEYKSLQGFLDYGSASFTQHGDYVEHADELNRNERLQAVEGMEQYLNDNATLFPNESLTHFRKRIANYKASEGWKNQVWYEPEDLEVEYDSLGGKVLGEDDLKLLFRGSLPYENNPQYKDAVKELTDRYGGLTEYQFHVQRFSEDFRARITETHGFFASNGPTSFATADPKEKWKTAYDARATIEVALKSGDPQQTAIAEGLIAWANSHGGEFAFQFNRMGEYYKAQLYGDELRLAWEAQTSPEHFNEILQTTKEAFGAPWAQEVRAEQSWWEKATDPFYSGAGPGAARENMKLPPELISRQQLTLRAIRDVTEQYAKRNGISYQEVENMPLTYPEAMEFIDDAMDLVSEAQMAKKGRLAAQNGMLQDREDTITIRAIKDFTHVLRDIDTGREPVVKTAIDMLGVAESGDITSAHEAGGRVSIGGHLMDLLTRFSKLQGTFIDSATMHSGAVSYVTKGGVFSSFWDYIEWASYQLKHNPSAVFQEPKESYDRSYDDKYELYQRAIWSEGEFAPEKHSTGEELMAIAGGMYHGAKTGIGEGWDKLRGFRPDYEEGQYPIKPTVVMGTNRLNKGAWDSAVDAWSAFVGDTQGVYLGQAIMEQLTPNIDPEDTAGYIGSFVLGIGFDIFGDPIMALKAGHLTAGVSLARKIKIVSTLDAAGKWTKSANRALADLTPKWVSEGKKLSMRALGLRGLDKVNESLLAADKTRKYLPKLPKLKVNEKVTGIENRPVIAVLDAKKFENAREAVESLGGGRLKSGHLKELEAFESTDVLLVFNSTKESKAAIKAGIITSESVQHGSLIDKGWRVMGKGKDGHGRIILRADAPTTGKLKGMIRRVRLGDGQWLSPEMLPQFELVRSIFRESHEFARWFFTAVRNDRTFMEKGMQVLLKDQKTLDKVHAILKGAGVLVDNADETARVLTKLEGPLKEIMALQGSGVTLMPTRLRNFLKGGGKPGAWEASFEYSRQIRLGKLSTALVSDLVIGSLRAMKRVAGPRLTTGLEKLATVAPEYALSLATLMKFGSQAFKDSSGALRASGLVGLNAYKAIQIPMESVSSMQAGRFGESVTGGRLGRLAAESPKLLTAAREVVDLPWMLSEALSFHSLSRASAEGWVQSQFARWALTEKGLLLGGTKANQKVIYTQLNYMVDGGMTFEEGLQHLAFVQKAKHGKVKFKSPGAGKDAKEIEINLETLQKMSPGTRDTALAEVINHITPDDLDKLRKLMDPFRENFKNLRKALDDMGRIGEEAGILKFEERYAPHIYLNPDSQSAISRAVTGGWDEALKVERGSAQDAKLSGHGLRRTGPPTIFEAEILGWKPITDLRESFHMRATSFVSDVHEARLIAVFANETGYKPISSVDKANELVRSHGQVRSLQDVGDLLAKQAEDVLVRSEELRALKKQVDQANANIKSATKEMGLTKEEVGKLMSAETFEDIVELLATKYSGNMSGPRAEFLLRGQGHVKFDAFLQRLVTEGGLSDDGAILMREIFSGVDTGVLQEYNYYASLREYNAAEAKLGRAPYPYRPDLGGFHDPGAKAITLVSENYAKGDKTMREVMSTLIHEFGHLAHNTLLSTDELAELEIIGRRLAESAKKGAPTGKGRGAGGEAFGTEKYARLGIDPAAYGKGEVPAIKEYFAEGASKDLGATYTDYYIGATGYNAPYEWFAQGMVEHIFGGHSKLGVAFPELGKIYDRLGDLIGRSMERLGKRSQPALFDAIRPYMDRFISGEKATWRGYAADLSTVSRQDLAGYVETRMAHLTELQAKGVGHLQYAPPAKRAFVATSKGAAVYDILRGIPKEFHVEARGMIDDIMAGKKGPDSLWSEPLGEHTVGHYIEEAHPRLVEGALKRDKTQVRQEVAENYPELAKKHGYVVDKPGAALARIEAEAVRDSIIEVDKRVQAINKIAADIGKELDIGAETALRLLEEMPKGSTKYLRRQMHNMKVGLRAAGKRARGAKGAEKEAELLKIKEFKSRQSGYVEHLAKMQELKKQMQGWGIDRAEQSMVTMTLYQVPSIDYLTYEQATRLLTEGKVSVKSLVENRPGAEFFKNTMEAQKAWKSDRVYGKYYVPATKQERSLEVVYSKEGTNGDWVVQDKYTKTELDSFSNKVAAKKFLDESLDVPDWMRGLDDVWIPIESAMVLQKVGLDYGLSSLDMAVRAGLMQNIIRAIKWSGLVTMTPTTITKTYLTGKALGMHFGRRNQLDAIQKLAQHSGAAILNAEIRAEYMAFMRGEVGTIEQATGGVIDAFAAKREMDMLLFNTYEARINVKRLIQESPTEEALAKMTREERMSYLGTTPADVVGKSLERTAAATTGKGITIPLPFGKALHTGVQRPTVVGVAGLAGEVEVGLAATLGGSGTTAGRLPTLQEVLFPWGPHATEATDNALRSFIYFMELKSGSGIRQGMANALDLARNYNNLTEFERFFVSQVPVMFYNFAKQNLKSVIDVLGTNPGRLALWPKVVANASESIPDELKMEWGSTIDFITSKEGSWFLPLDIGGLGIFDGLATIIAGGVREFRGEKEALSRSIGEAGRLMAPQATPWAHALWTGFGEDRDESALGSSRFSRATEQKILGFLSPTGQPDGALEEVGQWGKDAISNAFKLYYDEDGQARVEVADNNAGKMFNLLSLYLPIAQIGNNISRPKVLAEMGETTRFLIDALGIAKFYPFNIKDGMRKGEELLNVEARRVADAVEGLSMKESGFLEVIDTGNLTSTALKILQAAADDHKHMLELLRSYRKNLGVKHDPRTLRDKPKEEEE